MIRQRAALDRLPAYQQGVAPASTDVVKLSSNENPYPPLESVLATIRDELGTINRYPSIAAEELRARLAERHGVDIGRVCLGAGSVEVATQLVQASAGEGDEVMFAWRSFEAYPIIVTVAGAESVMVPLTADERHDLDAMAAAVTDRTRLILLCSPNNPTGATLTRDEVEGFLARIPRDVLVVLDEAYEHFVRDPEAVRGDDLVHAHPNLAVLHTFSKAYGLAGLRLGYAIAPLQVAENLRKVAVPFAVSALAQRAALASLDAEDELDERVDRIVEERTRLERELVAAGVALLPSQGNFIWIRTGDDTARVTERLLTNGVIARPFAGEGIRISIADAAASDRIIAALRPAAN